MGNMNRRSWLLLLLTFCATVLLTIAISGVIMPEEWYAPNFAQKNLSPSLRHLFGTDNLGRDMFCRTVKGLSNSILIGLLAASISSLFALFLGVLSATVGGWIDRGVNWLIDLCMGLPHTILLILISFMIGRGLQGVIIGVALTHWPALTRILRAEVLQLRSSQYIAASRRMGKSSFYIAAKHVAPHVVPQFIVGLILLFPHAILHEASITFLGFGLPIDMPAVGIILSEAMKYLSLGRWWLTVFPGVSLLAVVLMFDAVGEALRSLLDPVSSQQ